MSRNSHRPDPDDSVSRTRAHQKYSQDIYEIYKEMCWLCGKKGADTIDHVVPVLWGGADHPSNLKPAHRSCNSSKGASRPPKKCWTIPTLWIDGYGPRSHQDNRIYPKPKLPGPFAFLADFGFGGLLIWMGHRYAAGILTLVGLLLIVFLIAGVYLRWWWWTLTVQRIKKLAAADLTPEDPDIWLELAHRRAPGLKQLGGVQENTTPEG